MNTPFRKLTARFCALFSLIAFNAFAVVPVTVETVTQAPLTSEIEVSGTLYGKDGEKWRHPSSYGHLTA